MADETSREEQEMIKSAIGEPIEQSNGDSNMQQSIVNQGQPEEIPSAPIPYQDQAQQDYQQYGPQSMPAQQDYQQYGQDYAQYPSYSPDTITEISEQVVTEKLAQIRDQLEKVIDFKNIVDAKIDFLDERMKRIEKILDRLQLSVLQKVGEYVTNVEDIRKEVIETQKSFKSLLDKHHK
ncbi:hypothetical protein J4217_02680 [Candidatus Pacearchaeota archaeon]|nr:hypothetical protein [Candidatus Pacearchaeota archaeon]